MSAAPRSCALSLWHRPKPARYVWHHPLPLAWGGPTDQEKLAACDTHHYAIHVALDLLARYDGKPPKAQWKHFGRQVKKWALYAWDRRPPGPLPRTLARHE